MFRLALIIAILSFCQVAHATKAKSSRPPTTALCADLLATQEALASFLSRHKAKRGEIDDTRIAAEDFFPGHSQIPKLTQFNSNGDTLFHGMLISTALSLLPGGSVSRLVDLGAGSSIPTIKALLENPQHKNINVLAVDIDPKALAVTLTNASAFGFDTQYSVLEADLTAFLASNEFHSSDIVAANPPYLPMPDEIVGYHYVPVSSGIDGTKYTEAVLQKDYPVGTIVAVTWSSLTNPLKIIPLIEEKYEVLATLAFETPFGAYTSSDALLPHLQNQRSSGQSVFSTDGAGTNTYTIIGTVLRRR